MLLSNQSRFRWPTGIDLFIVVAAVVVLYGSYTYNLILFHLLIELISIAIAWGLFFVVWNTRQWINNHYLFGLGTALAASAVIDLLHAITYKGMNVFPGIDANLPTQLWLSARFLQSISMLLLPVFLVSHKASIQNGQKTSSKDEAGWIVIAYVSVLTLLLFLVFTDRFPTAYIEGQGLTPFKVYSEYLICLILVLSMLVLGWKRAYFDRTLLLLLQAATAVTIGSELALTVYINVYDLASMVGQAAKIVAFGLIYLAVIQASLQRPYDTLYRSLNQQKNFYQRMFFAYPTPRLLVDPNNGAIVQANHAAAQFYGYPLDILQSMRMDQLADTSFEQVRSTFQGGQITAPLDFHHRLASGEMRDVELHIEWMELDGQRLLHLVVYDVTERQQAEAELHQSREMYRLLADNISDVIWILDIETQKFRYVSASVERLRGYTVEEVLAQEMHQAVTPASLELLEAILPESIARFLRGERFTSVNEIEQPRKDGSTVWTETTTNFQVNEQTGRLEVYGVSRDITHRKHQEKILHARIKISDYAASHSLDECMQAALDEICDVTGSPIGFFHFVEADQKSLSLQAWSSRTQREFCRAEGKGEHYPIDQAGVWVDCVRERRPVIHNNYASLPGRRGLPDGHAPVIRELVVPLYRKDKVVAILGIGNKPTDYTEQDVEVVTSLADIAWEVSQRKQVEMKLSEATSSLNLMGKNLQDAALYILVHDANGVAHFEYLSEGIEILMGINRDDALRDPQNMYRQVLPEYQADLFRLEEESREHLSAFEIEVEMRHAKTGDVHWMLLRSTPRRRMNGSTVWYGVQIDITYRKQSETQLQQANERLHIQMEEIETLHAELQEQAIRDPLAGTYNRRYMEDAAARELARATRGGYPVQIVMVDMDNLKEINDAMGHLTGDQAILLLVEQLQRSTHLEDIVCRYGGDEFLVVFGDISQEMAVERIEEWRKNLENQPIVVNGQSIFVQFSAGIASYPAHGEALSAVIQSADEALYQAKALGKGRTVIFAAHPDNEMQPNAQR